MAIYPKLKALGGTLSLIKEGSTAVDVLGKTMKGLSEAQKVDLLTKNQLTLGTKALTAEQLTLALTTGGLSDEAAELAVKQILAAQATKAHASADEDATRKALTYKDAMRGLGDVMKANKLMSAITIAAIAIPAAIWAFDKLTTSLEEQQKKVADLTTKYQSISDEITALDSKSTTSPFDTPLTDQERARLEYLNEYKRNLEDTLNAERDKEIKSEVFGEGDLNPFTTGLSGNYQEVSTDILRTQQNLKRVLAEAVNPEPIVKDFYSQVQPKYVELLEYQGKLNQKIKEASDESLQKRLQDELSYVDADVETTKKLLDDLRSTGFIKIEVDSSDVGAVADALTGSTESAHNFAKFLEDLNNSIDSVQSALKTLQSAQDEYNQTGEISVDTVQELVKLGPEYLSTLVDQNGQISLNSDAVAALIEKKTTYLNTLAAESVAAYAVATLNELLGETTEDVGDKSTNAIDGIKNASLAMLEMAAGGAGAAAGVEMLDDALIKLAGGRGEREDKVGALLQRVHDYQEKISALINSAGTSIGGWTGSGKSGSSKDPYSDALKAKGNAYVDAIKREIDRLNKELEESNKYYDRRIDKLKTQKDELREQTELEDKLLSIEKAKADLAKAESQRTSKIFKDQEGFVWETDVEKVDAAQDNLSKTQKDYDRWRAEKEIDEQIEKLERLKKASQESFKSQIEDYEELKSSVQDSMELIGLTLEEHNERLALTASTTTMNYGQMAAAARDYADAVRELAAAKSAASSGKTPSTPSKRASGDRRIARAGIYNVDELGPEAILRSPAQGQYKYLDAGDTVFTADATQRLWEIANRPLNFLANHMPPIFPSIQQPALSSIGGSGDVVIQIDNMNLPNVQDTNGFFEEMKSLRLAAIQRTKKR